MSAASIRPSSSGSSRSFAVSRSATRAGLARSSPSVTSEKLTVALGNSETFTSPRVTGSSPVTAWIFAMTAWRTVSGGISAATPTSTAMPAADTAAMTRLNRMRPLAEGTGF